MFDLRHGDCLDVLRGMADNSVDAIVTDPPYGLLFMGKRWDYDVPSEDIWRECLRVLKPGGHLLAFAGTRTQHRMAVRIEDAGFEIRDMIAWVYGSGFPKSLDVSKAIDKRGGNPGLTAKIGAAIKAARESRGMSSSECDRLFCGGTTNWSWFEGRPAGQRAPTPQTFAKIAKTWPELAHLAEAVAEVDREVVGQKTSGIANKDEGTRHTIGAANAVVVDITAPSTPAARQWHGWGTALKPALEPITVARKPLIGTVAENVLTWGTGGVNVDGCRIASSQHEPNARQHKTISGQDVKDQVYDGGWVGTGNSWDGTLGRWPANLIHDGSEDVVGLFPETTQASWRKPQPDRAYPEAIFPQAHTARERDERGHPDTGSAARFFYCAKASKRDRDEGCQGMEERNNMRVNGPRENEDAKHARRLANHHPTVKPTDLMRYLCRLVTPPGGTVLDPFMGSGSTGKAAVLEGFNFIGIEREAEYIDIARARIEHVTKEPNLWQS